MFIWRPNIFFVITYKIYKLFLKTLRLSYKNVYLSYLRYLYKKTFGLLINSKFYYTDKYQSKVTRNHTDGNSKDRNNWKIQEMVDWRKTINFVDTKIYINIW